MVDAADLKSASCKGVWVRFPPSAHAKSTGSVNKDLPDLLTEFLSSGRQGISVRELEFYEIRSKPFVRDCELIQLGYSSIA